MKKNMGKTDRIVRLLLAVLISGLYFTNVISGILGITLVILAIVFLITSMLSFCPLYLLFGIKTCEISDPEKS